MPSQAEYSLGVETRHDEQTGDRSTILLFSTVREFRSFQYNLDVDDELDAASRTITLRIGGVRPPASLVPSSGVATKKLAYPGLSGVWRVVVTGARQTESFTLNIDGNNASLEPIEGKGFVVIAGVIG